MKCNEATHKELRIKQQASWPCSYIWVALLGCTVLRFVGACHLHWLRPKVLCMHAVVHNIAVAGGPGSLFKGRQ